LNEEFCPGDKDLDERIAAPPDPGIPRAGDQAIALRSTGNGPMKRPGSPMTSAGTIASVLALAFVLFTAPVQAQAPPIAKCTGEDNIAWSVQITGCTQAIASGIYAGKDLAKILLFRAKAYSMIRDLDRSLADVEEAIRLDPTNAFAVGARGDVYLVKQDYAHAVADYTEAAALEPGNALLFIGRGMAHIGAGDTDRAMADFEQAMALQPTLALGLYWRGIVRRFKGDVAAGEADIAAARKIDPGVR
jgi:tetratricopeptide (TPR) repeat protein